MQRGLEIPIEVTVQMNYSSKNKEALTKYQELFGKYYKEPVDGNRYYPERHGDSSDEETMEQFD